MYLDGDYLYPGQYSQTICQLQIRWYHLEGGTFSWQDPVHSWKAGPGEVMTVENSFILCSSEKILWKKWGKQDSWFGRIKNPKVTLYCHSFKVKAYWTDITRTFVDCVGQSCLWRIDRREARVLNVGTILVNCVRGWWDYEKAANSKTEIISNICQNRLMPKTSIAPEYRGLSTMY